MTLKDFQLITTAYLEREEDEWDRTAHIMSAVVNYAGMGVSEPIQAQDIFDLRKYQDDSVRPITSWEELKDMIEKM